MGCKIGILLLAMMFALIGCNVLDANQGAQAEAIASDTPVPTTTVIPSPVPPTATIPPANTLPPTWTPAPTRTLPSREATLAPSPTPSPTTIVVPGDGCAMFMPLLEQNLKNEIVYHGDTAVIYWSAITLPGYRYRVQLHHPAGMITLSEIVDDDRYAFRAEYLNSPGYTFGWEVQPVLGEDTLVCDPIAGEIYVEPYFE